MSRIALAAGFMAVVIAAVTIAGGSSPSYEEATSTVTKGGGLASAGNLRLTAAFGESASGLSASANFACEAGFIPAQGNEDRVVWAVNQPDPRVIGSTGKSALQWAATLTGTYEVLVNGTSIGNGSATAGEVVMTEVLGADLPADEFAEVSIRATDGATTQGVTYRVFNDRTAPTFKDVSIAALTAQVDRSMAADGTDSVTITVPGGAPVPHPLFQAGGFDYTLPAPDDEVAVEVVNKVGRTARRSLKLMVGDPPSPSEVTILGRTILWPTSAGEAEVDFTVATEDVKGKLTGSGTLRLPGDPTVYVLEVLKGKLSKKAKKKGNKLKITLKGTSATKPKVIVKGFWVNGIVTNAKITISVKKIFKDKWKEATFLPQKDNGNPIRIATVGLTGMAEDSRPDADVTVQTADGDFNGANPVPFTETLESSSDLATTITADDDAVPANRREHSVHTDVGW